MDWTPNIPEPDLDRRSRFNTVPPWPLGPLRRIQICLAKQNPDCQFPSAYIYIEFRDTSVTRGSLLLGGLTKL